MCSPAARSPVAGLLLGLALAANFAAAHAATKSPAASGGARPAPFAVDSLKTDDFRCALIAAPDMRTLESLRREIEFSANQFRRFVGGYPPKIGVVALGSLPDPAGVSPAELKAAGLDYVIMDWPERVKAPPARQAGARPARDDAPPAASPAERASRWYLRAFERRNAVGTPPPGRTRFVPDWFESALAGLATSRSEQNRRIAWMRERVDQRIAFSRFLEMSRPSGGDARLFDAQALSFARFTCEREDERFLGRALEILLTGQPQSAAFNIAKNFLPHPDVLEKEWVAWVKENAGAAR